MEATSRKPRPSEQDSESNSYQHYEHYYHILPLPQSKCMECYSNYGEYIIPNIIKPSILLQKKPTRLYRNWSGPQSGWCPNNWSLWKHQLERSDPHGRSNQSAVMLKLEKHSVCVKSCISPECWSASEYAWSLPVQAITPIKQHILSISPPQNLSAFHCFHHAERSHGQPAVGLNQRWHRSASPGVGKHCSASSIHDASLGPRTVPNCPAPIIRMFVYLHKTWLKCQK